MILISYCELILKGSEDIISTQKTSKFMKIIWITKISEKYNFKTSRIELSKALIRRGHRVYLIMEKKIGEKKTQDKQRIYIPSDTKPSFSSLIFGLYMFFYLPLIILRKKPNILLIDETTVWLPYVIGLKIFKIPLILDVRTLPVDNRRPLRFSISLNFSKYFVNGYTMITPELSEILDNRFNLGKKRIGIWSSGVSMDNFSNTISINNSEIEAHRRSNNFVLMYHGSYSPTRGIEELIESISILQPYIRKNIKLVMIGIGKENLSYLSNFSQKKGIESNIEFIPNVNYEMIPKYIYSSDIGVVPLPTENISWHSSAPLKTLEYLALGKPIIVTNIPFHQRIFEKGQCGILLEKNTPKLLADSITKLYQNKKKLEEMGKKGKEIVKKYYSWDNTALEVEKFLEKTLINSK
jgi:glycosyltransferase involved in cell wall biosynthesis